MRPTNRCTSRKKETLLSFDLLKEATLRYTLKKVNFSLDKKALRVDSVHVLNKWSKIDAISGEPMFAVLPSAVGVRTLLPRPV